MDRSNSKYSGKRPMTVDDDDDDVIITTNTAATISNNRRGTMTHHRRAHSDTDFRLDDLLLFDPSDLDLSSLDVLPPPLPSSSSTAVATPPFSADSPPFSDDSTSAFSGGGFPPKPSFGHHLRSLSVDSDFLDVLGLTGVGGGCDDKLGDVMIGSGGGGRGASGGEKRGKHKHSLSMDGSINMTSFLDVEAASSAKKAMGNEKLTELALIDPKRAKRFIF